MDAPDTSSAPGNGTPQTAATKRGLSNGRDIEAELRVRCPSLYREPSPQEVARQAEEDSRRAEYDRQRMIGDLMRSLLSAVGPRYAEARLGNFEVTTTDQRRVVDALQRYAAHIAEEVQAGRGVVLFGGVGSGKDHLLVGLAVEATKAGIPVAWQNGLDLFGEVRDRIGSGRSEAALVEQLTNPAILILSDPMPPLSAVTDFQACLLLRIVDRRYRARKPTWTTINVGSGGEADQRMGAPIVDRLRHDALCLHCSWPSYRKPAGWEAAQ